MTTELLAAAQQKYPLLAKHVGRIIKLMGDGALVEFGSVIAAVDCAVAIQRATEAANEGIRYRIGINLGEVIVEGSRSDVVNDPRTKEGYLGH